MTDPQNIANSVQEIEVGETAELVHELLSVLKDLDSQRIARTDEIVIRKGVLALIPVVARLEERIAQLESMTTGSVQEGVIDADRPH